MLMRRVLRRGQKMLYEEVSSVAERFGQYGQSRFLEILPGLFSWSIIIGAVVLSIIAPSVAIVFIIIFDLYWMLRVFYFVIHVIAAYVQFRRTISVDWEQEVQKIAQYERIYHMIFLPTYKEELVILEEACEALIRAKYRKDRMIVVFGGEERDLVHFEKCKAVLQEKYAGVFSELLFTVHPKDLPGEIPGKGSNLRYVASQVRKVIDDRGIAYDDIIVSAFDVDTVAHPQYFAKLAHTYLTIPDPTRASYQPVTVFSNNIWSATIPVRVTAFGTTFWLLGELVRPERLWTFSSHSMPWRMLVDVGYWEPDLVSEDSRIFMQAFLHYNGQYRVVPIFLPVSMDTVAEGSYMQSLIALYKQQRRWAWGVEHFPYMIRQFRVHPQISIWTKAKYIFNHVEGMFTWATAPLLIFILGYLPFLTTSDTQSALMVNSPYTLEFMMRGATFGVFVTGALNFMMLPPRPNSLSRVQWFVMLLQWAFLPITFILFGAFPALDAQTRFMLGKYLGFNVTNKNASSRRS